MNSRKHFIEDLATVPEIKNLIAQYFNTEEDCLCKEKFEKGEIKYFCNIDRKFYKKKSVI